MGRDTAERKNRQPAGKPSGRRAKRPAKGKTGAASSSESEASSPEAPALGAAPPGIAVGEVDAKAYLAKQMAESTVPLEERQRRRKVMEELQELCAVGGMSSEEYSILKQQELDLKDA
jgi:hypothetical protein